VTGASLGSPFLDRAVPSLLGTLARSGLDLAVLHQTGLADPDPVRAHYAREGIAAEVVTFVPDLAQRFGGADFVIACAGARTLAEIAAAGTPALFVPLASAAGDHQTENARAFAATTGAWWVSEAEWEPSPIAAQIETALRSAEVSQLLSKRLSTFVRPGAATAIAEDCVRLLAGP
jgi:UDP-N-acetylglucosamine--N-acetylmuramyl-(pentapeptide) pyrophosphoryl-undecaprenol N-acetylglucosamine transferase